MPRDISTPQLAWAAGHAIVLLASAYAFFGTLTFHPHNKAYYTALLGVILAWGIVVYKSLGPPQVSIQWLKSALLDENMEYLLLAIYWFFQRPIIVALIPYATFSLFHTLTFIRTNLLARSGPNTPENKRQAATGLAKSIQSWVKANYEHAIMFVAYVEVVVIFGRLILGALLFKNSFLAPFVYAHFLRLRYFLSRPTQKATANVHQAIQNLLNHPSVPEGVRNTVTKAQTYIDHWLSATNLTGRAPAASHSASSTSRSASASAAASEPATAHTTATNAPHEAASSASQRS